LTNPTADKNQCNRQKSSNIDKEESSQATSINNSQLWQWNKISNTVSAPSNKNNQSHGTTVGTPEDTSWWKCNSTYHFA
jgi:hypothetical protein